MSPNQLIPLDSRAVPSLITEQASRGYLFDKERYAKRRSLGLGAGLPSPADTKTTQ